MHVKGMNEQSNKEKIIKMKRKKKYIFSDEPSSSLPICSKHYSAQPIQQLQIEKDKIGYDAQKWVTHISWCWVANFPT